MSVFGALAAEKQKQKEFDPVFVMRYCLGRMQSVTKWISCRTTNLCSRYPEGKDGNEKNYITVYGPMSVCRKVAWISHRLDNSLGSLRMPRWGQTGENKDTDM